MNFFIAIGLGYPVNITTINTKIITQKFPEKLSGILIRIDILLNN